MINICSLSWPDTAAGLMSHPLWSHFDIEFKNFNRHFLQWPGGDPFTARQLQGRLLHTNLYQLANNDCYLFDNLSKLGFTAPDDGT